MYIQSNQRGQIMGWITVGGKRINTDWPEQNRRKREIESKKYLETWISPSRLKAERNWTDGAIKKFLAKVPYKIIKTAMGRESKQYLIKNIEKVEQKEKFKDWMAKRIKQQSSRMGVEEDSLLTIIKSWTEKKQEAPAPTIVPANVELTVTFKELPIPFVHKNEFSITVKHDYPSIYVKMTIKKGLWEKIVTQIKTIENNGGKWLAEGRGQIQMFTSEKIHLEKVKFQVICRRKKS